MTATVYRARPDGDVDWRIVGTLEDLHAALHDGWFASQLQAREAADAVVASPAAMTQAEYDANDDPNKPAFTINEEGHAVDENGSAIELTDDAPKRHARKKR